MDRGTMMLTSSVSIPKDSKQLCWVNKLQLGNLQNYEHAAMLIMLQEGKRLNRMSITPRQVNRLFINISSLIIHLEISIHKILLILIKLRATTNVVNSKQWTTALTLYA